ncbi:MAG TPA: D-cysteine desulfhydrase family protein [Tepidisphaeraceae bacterium]|jgi:D-cysteine desulfhydrase|nr:D-cysteine desulfhydrase family protein [Tepidisphaeraceae bacterium]
MHIHEPKRILLGNLPTPVVELKNLAGDLGVERVLLKRDDLTGVELSGNKVRKLEYVVADVLEKGCDTLVTHGGFQSNHCRATAAIGARLGLRVRLILRAAVEKPVVEGNLLLDSLFGAVISYHLPEEYNGRRKELIEGAMEEERRAGRRPYFFPVGASVPLGTWGYIRCVHELVQQLGAETKVDLYSAVSSSGTHAGLMLGKGLFGLEKWRVVGVPVSDSVEYFREEVGGLVGRTVEEFGLGVGEMPMEFLDGFIGRGYAMETEEGMEAMKLMGRREGIALDPTYTGKGFAGFLHAMRSGMIREGAVPVYVHTGGVFGLMARGDLFA